MFSSWPCEILTKNLEKGAKGSFVVIVVPVERFKEFLSPFMCLSVGKLLKFTLSFPSVKSVHGSIAIL